MNKPSIKKLKKSVARPLRGVYRRIRPLYVRVVAQLPASRLSVKDQAFFAKRLSFLITAGVPIMESLTMIREQTRSRTFEAILDVVIKDVANGQHLSKSLGRFPDMFGEFAINLIKVGESSGTLSENLDYLAEELKKKQALRRKVIGALIYPALITTATLGITAFLMVYLFPKIMPVFLSLRMELPLSTRIVIALSNFLRHYGFALTVLVIVLCTVFSVLRKRNLRFQKFIDRRLINLPVIGVMTRSYHLANFTRTLGLLLKSGTSLPLALTITADTSSNRVYQEHAHALDRAVSQGQTLSVYLDKHRQVFGDVLCQMIMVGERSGNLSNTLLYLSDFYEHELDDFTKGLSNLIEPALMISMGLLIGFIAVSIITPIYAITQNLHP